MRINLVTITVRFLALAAVTPAFAHRLDEYLQATFVSVEKDRLTLNMYLTPGTAVLPLVFADIDADRNGVVSAAEQRRYAARVLDDLSFALNGDRLTPRLISMAFPRTEQMQEGLGDIHLEIEVKLPARGPQRTLRLTNQHHARIAAYQVNCLVARDPDIRIGSQRRDRSQSVFELEYTQITQPSL